MVEHPSVLHTMNTGYPSREPKLHTQCTYCGTEIFVGEEVVNHNDYLYCDRICMATELLKSGEARKVVAGE